MGTDDLYLFVKGQLESNSNSSSVFSIVIQQHICKSQATVKAYQALDETTRKDAFTYLHNS